MRESVLPEMRCRSTHAGLSLLSLLRLGGAQSASAGVQRCELLVLVGNIVMTPGGRCRVGEVAGLEEKTREV